MVTLSALNCKEPLFTGDVVYADDGSSTVRIWAVMPQIRTDRRKVSLSTSPALSIYPPSIPGRSRGIRYQICWWLKANADVSSYLGS